MVVDQAEQVRALSPDIAAFAKLDAGKGTIVTAPGEGDVDYVCRNLQDRPEAASVRVCPIFGLSSRDESHDAAKCLAEVEGSRILIVTSDFRTRRALSVFRHEVHGKTFSIAAAHDNKQCGTRWWMHRQWAKTCADEWRKLLWWNGVDRWRWPGSPAHGGKRNRSTDEFSTENGVLSTERH